MRISDWSSDVCSSDLETLDASREQSREARSKLEDAVSRMGELEGTRQALQSERRSLAEARDQARTTARESSETAHALALTLESQRTQVAALSQSLERMGSQPGPLDSRLGELATQLAPGDEHPAVAHEPPRTAVTGQPCVTIGRAKQRKGMCSS